MDNRKKKLIEEIKKLKSIKADDGFKFALRKKIYEEAGRSFVINMSDSRLNNQQVSQLVGQAPNLQKIFNNLLPRKQNMFLPLLLIAALLGGGAGATYASQSSLPGETLYPVKLATEKVQTVLNVNNDTKEAGLHIKFSEERLNEVDKLAQKGKAEPKLVKEAVDNYKKELSEAKQLLASASNPSQSTQIAQNLADATNQNKEILVKISGEIESDEALDFLKDAWEEAVEHNDVATIELLKSLASNGTSTNSVNNAAVTNNVANTTNATTSTSNSTTGTQNTQTNQTATTNTSTTNTSAATALVQDIQSQRMVENKIAEASHKISEAEKYIAKKGAQGSDVAAATAKVTEAKTLLSDAQNLLAQAKYTEAFLKAKDAHQAAQIAKESLENEYKSSHHEKEDSDDNEIIFVLPTAPASTDEVLSQPTTNNFKEESRKEKEEDKKEKKHEEEKEQERD